MCAPLASGPRPIVEDVTCQATQHRCRGRSACVSTLRMKNTLCVAHALQALPPRNDRHPELNMHV